MFRRLNTADAPRAVTLTIGGRSVTVPAGETVAAAILAAGEKASRTTPVGGAARGPYCMMGVCFDCLVTIDGVPNRQACMTEVREGMAVAAQDGARGLRP